MSKCVIAAIVAKHDLKPGDTMRTLDGDMIARSRVISERSVIYPDGEGYLLISENVILGEETHQFLSAAMLEQLRSYGG